MIDAVRQAIHNAARATSPVATAEVRANAVSAGWPRDVANTLRVSYDGDGWTVQSADDRAEDWEYGDGERVPSPAIRQFLNRPEGMEKTLIEMVENRLGGIL